MKKYTDSGLIDSKFNDLVKLHHKTMDFSNNNIHGFCADNLENNRYLETLYLDNNQIGQLSIRSLAESLAKNSSIKKLSLAYNSLGSKGVSILVDYLSDSSCSKSKIEILDLTHNYIGDLDDQVIENITKLKLKELVLDDNSLTDKMGFNLTLKKLIQKFQNSSTLTLLSCTNANISPELFPDLILLAKNRKLRTIRFNGVNLNLDDQARNFLHGLTKLSHIRFELWDINEQICTEFADKPGFVIKENECARKIFTKQIGVCDRTFFRNIDRERARTLALSSNENVGSASNTLNSSSTLKSCQ